jgi:hypothetical protein
MIKNIVWWLCFRFIRVLIKMRLWATSLFIKKIFYSDEEWIKIDFEP